MIEIIPSISVLNNQCVRLTQGNYSKQVVYGEQPLVIAQRFEEHGIRRVHLIDLDGAKAGKGVNFDALQLIAAHTSLDVNYGGGVSTDGDIAKVMEYGAKRVTVGSLAYRNRDLFSSWIISYGRDVICLSADARDGKIQIGGWQQTTEIDLFDHIDYFYNRSVQYIKCSDVGRDGLLQGPNLEMYRQLMARFPEAKILASGGVSSIDDIKRLRDVGVYAVIFGRAYYENRISLNEIERFMANMTEV
jgi:phosphoribosylformimino-5-aminoimidazole carboxamide ribotide isomerase